MIRPPTKLTPWSSASRVTERVTVGTPTGSAHIPPAACTIYPITVPPTTAAAPIQVIRRQLATPARARSASLRPPQTSIHPAAC